MSDRVTIEISGGVADVRLNRADKMNALDHAMFDALVAAGERLRVEPGLRAVVLSGEGRAFCAGLDMGNFAAMGAANAAAKSAGGPHPLLARKYGPANREQHVAYVWRQVPVPVIGAIHGVAFGGGFQIALGPDIRLVEPETKMSVMEIKWGLVPDMAGLALMRTLARDDVVRELTYTGRVFTGAEAVQLGFATRLEADPRASALAMAAEIAQKNPDAIRAAKRLFNAVPDSNAADILMAESVEQAKLIGSPNQIEAVMANMQKRAANFSD